MAEMVKAEDKENKNINSPLLSIIIVNYNVKEYILNCIQSIQDKIDANRCPYEVIVSDNGSVDGSVEAIRERFPWVKVIENNANLGLGKANNVGAEQAEGQVLFFLNPDILIIKGIEEMVDYIGEHKEGGLLVPVIFDRNNHLAVSDIFPNNILFQIISIFPGVLKGYTFFTRQHYKITNAIAEKKMINSSKRIST
ncbi:MAG: glycosyltransferase [Deltaproteobacteria bacterium]|nr:glycosyltransferase [Deltaproteobacteria bacterium]